VSRLARGTQYVPGRRGDYPSPSGTKTEKVRISPRILHAYLCDDDVTVLSIWKIDGDPSVLYGRV
jgi:hypothetical protein